MLAAGTRLGPYEILSAIGAGGMGEVYRARDTRLLRDVAVKVLPASVSVDPDRIARFEREARATAALNHPNIVAVYDVGTSNGVAFVVSELLEGETLRERVRRGPLPVRKSVEIAMDIASGLAAAHGRGIAHRDLKPENVFVGSDGHVKILDFGIAKLLPGTGATPDDAVSTVSMNRTDPGALLGTVGYMAPEQVRGQAVDHRCDIFAFGAIVYEMLSGTRAFRGASAADTLAAILNSDPPDLTHGSVPVPSSLDAIARRCMEKDPRDRFQSARDAGYALQAASSHMSDVAKASIQIAPRNRRSLLSIVIAGVLMLAALAALIWFATRPRVTPAARLALAVVAPADIEVDGTPALSPDGRQIAFVGADASARRRLYVRPFDVLEATAIKGSDDADQPFWSPDGKTVAFFARGKLWRADIGEGAARPIAEVADARGGTWNRDNVIVIAPSPDGGLYRVASDGGALTPVTTLDRAKQEISHRWPRFLPDGRHLLFVNRIAESGPSRTVITATSVDGGPTVRLMPANSTGVFADGRLFFQRNSNLLAQPFDPVRLQSSGDASVVVSDVWDDIQVTAGLAGFDASANAIAVRPADRRHNRIVWVDRSGKNLGAASALDTDDVVLSPDGRTLAANGIDPQMGSTGMWIQDIARGNLTRITPPEVSTASPVWSPDSRRLVYSPVRAGTFDLFIKEVAPGGAETLLLHSDRMKQARSWSPNGQYVLFNAADAKTGIDLWVVEVYGNAARIFAGGPGDQGDGCFSPNGRWVAYVSSESGKPEVYLRPFSSAEAPVQVSVNGGALPQWRSDGNELFYVGPDNQLNGVPITIENGALKPGTPTALFRITARHPPAKAVTMSTSRLYAVAPGGQRFLVSEIIDESKAAAAINVLFNWIQ